MKLIMDIPKEEYELVRHGNKSYTTELELMNAVANGVPLPKGCGRLGDLDKLYTEMNNGIKAGNYEEGYENYGHINDMDDCLECVKYADTIIEPS